MTFTADPPPRKPPRSAPGLSFCGAQTTDFLLFEEAENVGPLNLKDKTLYEKMRLLDALDEEDRGVIDAFLTKRQMWIVLNRQAAAG